MPPLPRFDPPAHLQDVPAGSPFYDRWSAFISGLMGRTRKGNGGGVFYNPTLTDLPVHAEKPMTWMGFPRELLQNGAQSGDGSSAFITADADETQRMPQIEYFEWKADRSGGKITKVTFVTETADYYQELWAVDREAVVRLYRELVSPEVMEKDLHTKGVYNKFNKWNTTHGIVHYIHPANSFNAAIGLSRDAVKSPAPYNDNYEARPALADRLTSADPRISFDIHMLIRKGLSVSLKNPIGLYIAGWDNSGITHPDGSPAENYWRIVRGTPGMVLRLEYEVPASLGFVVGDLRIGGRPITYGGQLAELVTVSLTSTMGAPATK
ncbi:hypothetical protein V9K67_23195 [Paraflavisolibacter sp. H34]|uniref:hypothetical protein n=1 Tax=Huijunlia imazamoxiresistens TaxID=3127457 RepID=UPI00301A311F